jgi:hypothetical protein
MSRDIQISRALCGVTLGSEDAKDPELAESGFDALKKAYLITDNVFLGGEGFPNLVNTIQTTKKYGGKTVSFSFTLEATVGQLDKIIADNKLAGKVKIELYRAVIPAQGQVFIQSHFIKVSESISVTISGPEFASENRENHVFTITTKLKNIKVCAPKWDKGGTKADQHIYGG